MSQVLCACGCGLPATTAKPWAKASVCRARFLKNGNQSVPMRRCVHCGEGVPGHVGNACGRCAGSKAARGLARNPGLIATLTTAFANRDRYPVQVSDPTRVVPVVWADEAERSTREQRQRGRGLTRVACPVCASPAWQEPPCLRVTGGVETTEHPIRCPQCNPIRQVGGGRCA